MLPVTFAILAAVVLVGAVALLAGRRRARSGGIPGPIAVLVRNAAAVERRHDAETVIALPGQTEGLAFNRLAERCWALMDGRRSVLEIALTIARESRAGRMLALREVRSLAGRLKRALLALERSEWDLVHVHTCDLFAGGGSGKIVEIRAAENLIIHAAACAVAREGRAEPWRCGLRARWAAAAAMREHRAREAGRDAAAAHFQVGWDHCTSGRLEEAEAAFRACAEAAPGWANVHYQLGYVSLRLRRYDDAIRRLERTDALSPGYYMAREYLDQARRLKAGDLPHEAFLLFDRANAAGLSDPDAAIRLARRALEISPRFPSARLVLARAYQKKNLLDVALAELDRTLEMKPDRATLCHALLSRGLIFMAQGRAETAMREWEKVIEIDGSAAATRTALSAIASASVAH